MGEVHILHCNLDDDNASDTVKVRTVGVPKYPGSDLLETVNAVTGEDDLKVAGISIGGLGNLTEGKVTLSLTGNFAVWKAAAKGTANLLLDSANAQKTWDLSITDQHTDFEAVKNSLYIEGKEANSFGTLVLEYQRQVGGVWKSLGTDTVKLNAIAANDGAQPFADPMDGSTSRGGLKASFPSLVDCEYNVLGPIDVTFNCWGWSVGRSDAWCGARLIAGTTKRTDPVTGITDLSSEKRTRDSCSSTRLWPGQCRVDASYLGGQMSDCGHH